MVDGQAPLREVGRRSRRRRGRIRRAGRRRGGGAGGLDSIGNSGRTESLDLRYPLVCAECAPAVESTIRERDYRVKAQALGWYWPMRLPSAATQPPARPSSSLPSSVPRHSSSPPPPSSSEFTAIAAAYSGARSRQFSGALHLPIHASLLASNSLSLLRASSLLFSSSSLLL
jgi:hypothetical protein